MKFKLRRYYLYYVTRILAFLLGLLPLRVALCIADVFGTLAFYALSKYRRIALENLGSAFGKEKTTRELNRIARDVFRNFARNAVELINFPKLTRGNINSFVRIKNIDILKEALDKGKGVIIATGHFGNWELLAVTVSLKGYKGAVVGRRIYFDKYDSYLNSIRRDKGVKIIYRDESPKNMLRVLKDNGVLGILADQDVDSVNSVFVNFFGMPAYTPAGPAALARASGAALIPGFIVRENGHHVLMLEEPIQLSETGEKEKDIVSDMQKYSDVLEEYVRRYPEFWVWVHRRWKTKKVNA